LRDEEVAVQPLLYLCDSPVDGSWTRFARLMKSSFLGLDKMLTAPSAIRIALVAPPPIRHDAISTADVLSYFFRLLWLV